MTTIYGHDRLKVILKRGLENHHLSHAYLFHGIEGIGKRQLALFFAASLLERGSKLSPELIRHKMQESNHPDYTFLSGAEESIKIEQVETLQDFLRSKPLEGAHKVVLIDDAHTMTAQAQNRMLKTLEEPPAFACIILITHRPKDLLPTIHSRVETLSFNPLSKSDIQGVLMDSGQALAMPVEVLAGLAEGSAMKALQMGSDPEVLETRDFVLAWFNDIISGSALNAQRRLDRQELDKNKDKAIMLLRFARIVLRDIIVGQEGAAYHQLMTDKADQLQTLAHRLSATKTLRMLDSVDHAERRLEGMVQPLLVMDVLNHTLQEVCRD